MASTVGDLSFFSQKVVEWYNSNKRDLPWRGTKDPYAIWVSEIILQQTRVAQGYDYFVRFMRRFPDLASLASASEDEVLAHWQGLGYYSRARNLHKAAVSMQGVFPATYEGVRALAGVGDYTAAAICSLAYDMPCAVVDGNVFRVLSRYFGIDVPIDTVAGKRYFAALAQRLIDVRRPALYNQAIMDFGALQCTPHAPACASCTLADGCMAKNGGTVDALPMKSHKTVKATRYFSYLLAWIGSCICLHKRTENDIWKNLYEFPLIETCQEIDMAGVISSAVSNGMLVPEETPTVRLLQRGVKHVLSHQVIYANFYELALPGNSRSFGAFLQVEHGVLSGYAMPRLLTAFLDRAGGLKGSPLEQCP